MKQRVLTAAIGIPIVMAACFYTQPWPFAAIVIACAVIGCLELARMGGQKIALLGSLLPMLMVVAIWDRQGMAWISDKVTVTVGLLVLFVIGALAAGRKGYVFCELATLYVGAPLAAAIMLQQTNGRLPCLQRDNLFEASTFILLPLIPLWIGDSAAIFAGKAWGKHPLAPKISPKKTWEGGIANFLGCILGAIGVGYFLGLPVGLSIVSGVISGILGQAGDLYESALKRKVGIKDSGNILPGHGGVLDRLDSLLATAIPIALIVFLWPK